MALTTGIPAPHFSLKSKTAEGLQDFNLSDLSGKQNVVLLFFPAAFTGVCTQEFCDVTGGVQPLENATVVGISVDSPFAQEAWAKANGITVPLVSDFSKAVTRAYDVELPDFIGLGESVSKRAAFVIDTSGVIRYSEETATPGELPNFDAIRAVLKELS